LRPAIGLNDEAFGLILNNFELRDIAIEFSCILAYQLVAFPNLRLGIRLPEDCLDGLHDEYVILLSAGRAVALQRKTDFFNSAQTDVCLQICSV
jgi:hypothetical protein